MICLKSENNNSHHSVSQPNFSLHPHFSMFAGGLMTIDEGFGQTYSKSKANVTKKDMCWTIDGGINAIHVILWFH